MPNRILKESICASENIDQLSPFAEIAFYRLMVNCDDYGRMDARAKILKSRLFPLKDIDDDHMISALEELEASDLIMIYHVDGKPYLQMKTWERHQQIRNHKSKYPSPSDADCNQLKSNDINCNQMISNDSKCSRNPIQSESESESKSESESESELLNADDAKVIQKDHDHILNAAEDAGFKMSNDVRASLIALYADYGLQKMLDGFRSCVDHGATNLAYLKAVLKGEPRKQPDKQSGKVLTGQQFTQRDYSNEDDEIFKRMIEMEGSA